MIKLINGDCFVELKKIDLGNCIFVSDPPFNIGYKYNMYKDTKKENEYYSWLAGIFGTKPQAIIHYPENIYKYSFQIGVFPERVISWVYNSNTAKQHRDIAFFNIKPDLKKVGQPYKNINDKRIKKRIADGKRARLYDWWYINQIKNVSKKHKHPCEMPLEVMKRIVGILPENTTIVDPFMGTGTTGLACKLLNRDFIGIEIDPDYFIIASNKIYSNSFI